MNFSHFLWLVFIAWLENISDLLHSSPSVYSSRSFAVDFWIASIVKKIIFVHLLDFKRVRVKTLLL